MSGSMKQVVLGAMLALGLVCSVQAQQAATGSTAPTGFVAPELPAPDESNAVRAKTQPGNNAPVWRAHSSRPPAKPGARCATTGSFPTAARCC